MKKTLSIYINGTDEPIGLEGDISLANVLHTYTLEDEDHASICLNGCGVENPDLRDLGVVFTFNLEAQIDKEIQKIRQRLDSGEELILNLYGFSRGGAGVLWMCQKLKDISADRLTINVCAFEPVPGNFVRTAYADTLLKLNTTLSSQIADLSDCDNVKKMLLLYTNAPLPDIICHGPLLPIKPRSAEVIVDVIPGTHRSAELYSHSRPNHYNRWHGKLGPKNIESTISFHYVRRFLMACGTQFNEDKQTLFNGLEALTDHGLKQRLESLNRDHCFSGSSRAMHFYNEIQTKPSQPYLNLLHKELETGMRPIDATGCTLSVRDPNPEPNHWNGQRPVEYMPMLRAVVNSATSCFKRNNAPIVHELPVSKSTAKPL